MKKLIGAAPLIAAMAVFSQSGPVYTDHNIGTFAVPITNWNMLQDRMHYIDITSTSNPAKPADFIAANIIGVDVVIRDDNGENMFNLSRHRVTSYWGGWFHLTCYTFNNSCQVQLNRGQTGMSFSQNSNYDALGHRGYVYIQYHTTQGGIPPQNLQTHWQEMGSLSMQGCVEASPCGFFTHPTTMNTGNAVAISASIRSDNEPRLAGFPSSISVGRFENINSSPNENPLRGKGGVLSFKNANYDLIMPSNWKNTANFTSRFKTARYNGTGNRGYFTTRYSNPTTLNARQPFVIKSKYVQIGNWAVCSTCPNPKVINAMALTNSAGRIVSLESSIHSDPIGSSIYVTNLRRGDDREEGQIPPPNGGKATGEIAGEFTANSGSIFLELDGVYKAERYWAQYPHSGTASNRGWVKADFLAARCGEGGFGAFTNAINIGYSNASDCHGYAQVDNIKTHVIESQGNDIFNSSDQFRYLYRSGSAGNFTIVAKIDQVEETSYWSRGCLMLRTNTNPNSPHVSVCRLGEGMPIFQYRTGFGGSTTRTNPNNTKYRHKWAKLVKSGNTITGFIADRDDNWNPTETTGWEQIGTVNASLGANYTFGLGVSSFNASNPATAGFGGVQWW